MFKIKNEELLAEITGEIRKFPKYTTQLINLANQNAQATRPKVVGQLSDLIQQCPHSEHEKWKEWYLQRHPDAIGAATARILEMVKNLSESICKIDEPMVREWCEDLIINKTFIGLKAQEVILKVIARRKGTTYRLSTPEDESRGILRSAYFVLLFHLHLWYNTVYED